MKKIILIICFFFARFPSAYSQEILKNAEWINWGGDEGNDLNSLDYSPNGKYFASGGNHQTILFNSETYEAVRILRSSLDKTTSVCFSPDNKYLVSGGNDQIIYIWELKNFSLKTTINVKDKIHELRFSPDGKYLLACMRSDNNLFSVTIFNMDNFAPCKGFPEFKSNIVSALISKDNTKLIAVKEWTVNEHDQNSPGILIFDLETHKLINTLKSFSESPGRIIQSNDGKYLACNVEVVNRYSEYYYSGVWLYNLSTEQEIFVETSNEDYSNITTLSFSPDNLLLVTASDNIVNVVSLQSGETIKIITSKLKHINSLAFSIDGKKLLIGGFNNTIEVWDLNTSKIIKIIQGLYGVNDQGSIRTIDYSPNGKLIASGTGSSPIQIWDAENGKEIRTIISKSANHVLSFTPNSNFIAAAYGGPISIYDVTTGKLYKTLKGHRYEINGFTKLVWQMNFVDNEHLLSASGDKTVKLWEIETDTCLKTFYDTTGQRYENPSGCYSFVLLNEDSLLITGHHSYLKIWNYYSGKELYKIYKRELGFIYKLFYNPQNNKIYSYNYRYVFQIDLQNQEVTQIFDLGNFRDIAHSNNKKYVATCHDNGDIKIWDVNSYKNIYTYRTNIPYIYSIVWSPDDKSMVLGASDGTVMKIRNVDFNAVNN